MKFLKKIKGEFLIYAIALMLVTAGYFNYSSNLNNNSIETNAENDEFAEIGDARLVDSNDVVENDSSKEVSNINENGKEEEGKGDEVNENDYFVSSKLDRDKNYASMISTYTNIIEDSNVSQTEKETAMKEITNINNTKNAISICENLITTKGFANCIIFVNKDSINIVVENKEKLSTEKVAQIQNIISREFDCKIENIHITER